MMGVVKNSRQRGFTLIEALVALLVLSIGLLGVASMQLKALQGAHAAYQRSLASLAAQDAQERLWAQLAEEGGMTCPSWSDANALGDVDWNQDDDSWGSYLPGFADSGQSSVTRPDSSICQFVITVSWTEERFSAEPFSYAVRLPGE